MTIQLPLLISAERAAEYLSNPEAVFIDRCQEALYKVGHIPGAIHLAPRKLMSGTPPAPGLIPDIAALERLFSSLGISEDKHVIMYDDEGGGWCARLAWTFDCLRYSRYSVIDGGFQAWRAAGLPLDRSLPQPQPSSFTATFDHRYRADADFIKEHLGNSDFVIWDARSQEEHTGARKFSQRGGRIPGAVHYEWTNAIDVSNNMKLRPLDDIRAELASLGIDQHKHIVTHCQSHHRSSFTYFLGKLLGLDIKGYDGSWGDWGNRDDTPIETDHSA